nr:pentatricopeptide repeat-containing protein [Tanacetum cinerariifolium]
MKTWVEIIREDVFCHGGNRDHFSACLGHMLYCFATSMRYNFAYFIAKRMDFFTRQPRIILPYGMLLTRMYNHVMSNFTELSSDRFVLYDRIMYPLALQHERKTRNNYGTKRGHHSSFACSFSAFYYPSSSHHIDDDNDEHNEGTSRVSTPSLTRSVNSLSNDVSRVSTNPPHDEQNMENFFTRQTMILNRQVQMQDEHRSGLRSIGKGIKNLWKGKKK